jgi:hypothetical protein
MVEVNLDKLEKEIDIDEDLKSRQIVFENQDKLFFFF